MECRYCLVKSTDRDELRQLKNQRKSLKELYTLNQSPEVKCTLAQVTRKLAATRPKRVPLGTMLLSEEGQGTFIWNVYPYELGRFVARGYQIVRNGRALSLKHAYKELVGLTPTEWHVGHVGFGSRNMRV
jgi:hypothetical protein